MSAQISVPEIPPWVPPKPTKQDDIEWAPLNTLDLSKVTGDDFTEVPDDLVKTVGEAFRTSGFMYAENHGWTYDQVLRQFAVGQYAFDGVAPEDKDKYKADIIKSGSFVGYKAQGHWRLDGVPDRIEQLNFGSTSFSEENRKRLYPESLQPFIPEIREFARFNHGVILRKILSVLSRVLKLPADTLWKLSENPEEKGIDLLRYAMYHTPTKDDDKTLGGVRLQGHTDFNSVSILWSQPITSLEVLMPDDRWRLVKHRDNALVLNLGDAMHFLSGGYFKATIHRVVAPPEDQAEYVRLGMFYFALFNKDVQLRPLIESPVVAEAYKDKNFWSEAEAKGLPIPTAGEWEAERVRRFGQQQAKKREDGHDEEEILGGVAKITLYNTNEKNQRTPLQIQKEKEREAATRHIAISA